MIHIARNDSELSFFICDECWCSYINNSLHERYHPSHVNGPVEKDIIMRFLEEGRWTCPTLTVYANEGFLIQELY